MASSNPDKSQFIVSPNVPVRVVALGASAGGLEALELFFSNMPSDSGMAFVVVQHLSPDFKSVMDELLSRRTQMEVSLAEDHMRVTANCIYLLPRKSQMTIENGVLRIAEQESDRGLFLPIDTLFRSLAAECGPRAVGIVLSGTGSDGSRGIRDIHNSGGLVFAQTIESAKFDGMPRAASDTGIVDFLLPPNRMPQVLLAYAGVGRDGTEASFLDLAEDEYAPIFKLLKEHHRIDFSVYKPATVRRRIERRMLLGEVRSLEDYVELLVKNPDDLDSLLYDLLIGVTRFFRDEEAFKLMRNLVIPELLELKAPGEELRVWVCGCATGEEAYSMAMLLADARESMKCDVRIRIFATDVHLQLLNVAARGVYTEAAVASIPENLRERYLTEEGGLYRVTSDLRQMVVFSEHDLTKDPPFTKIDLVSCRNLLIYFKNAPQSRAIRLFHYALNVNGMLMLGPSETLGSLKDEFVVVDAAWKIYRKFRNVKMASNLRELSPAMSPQSLIVTGPTGPRTGVDARLTRAYDMLLRQYMPPSALIDDSRRLLHSFGDVAKHFALLQGRPTLDFIEMLREDLRVPAAAALRRCISEARSVAFEGIRLDDGPAPLRLNILISPIKDTLSDSTFFHVSFEEVSEQGHRVLPGGADEDASGSDVVEGEVIQVTSELGTISPQARDRIRDLELQLQYAKEHLQTTVEELETSNEELQATNEELLASNEELQSTNEELHSVNEELYTVNAEYEKKNRELIELNSDIDNILSSIDIGTLFLDEKLEVRKFTASIKSAFNLLPQDIGRSIRDIVYRVEGHESLPEDALKVLNSGESLDCRVRSMNQRELLVRIRPYQVPRKEVSGVVLTFVDVTDLSEVQARLLESEDRFRRIADSTPALLWMVGSHLEGLYFNDEWMQWTGWPSSNLEGIAWQSCFAAEDLPEFLAACQIARARGEGIVAEMRLLNADGKWRWFKVKGAARDLGDGDFHGFVFSAVDIDDIRNAANILQRQVEEQTEALRKSEAFFRIVGETATDGYWDWKVREDELHLSPCLKKLFGYEDDELPSTIANWNALIHPEDRHPFRTLLDEHLESGEPFSFETRFFHKDGGISWVMVRGTPIPDENGLNHRIVGTHTNITPLKEAEALLRANEYRFRGVFETELIGIGLLDAGLVLTEANGALLKLLKIERSRLPIPIAEVCPEKQFEVTKRLVDEAFSDGVSSIGEIECGVDGEHRVVARIGYSQLKDSSGELVLIAQDITAQESSLQALKLSEERLARAIDATQVGLFDWEADAPSLWASEQAYRNFGMEPRDQPTAAAEFIRKMHPEDANSVTKAIRDTFEKGVPYEVDYRVILPGGEERWIYSKGRLITLDQSEHFVGTNLDITERYASQAALRLQTAQLEKSNRDLEQFAYIASHDLKEPLRSVTGFLQILKSRHRDHLSDEGSDFVLRAVDAAHRMHTLIDGLLDFSTLGRVDLKVQPVALNDAVAISVSQLNAAICESDAVLEVADLPTVSGDQSMLSRLFLNLIGNSIKFSNGHVPEIRIWSESSLNEEIIYIQDNGIGIDSKFAERVFVIFQRLHTQNEYSGTGIGLSLCRKIMERHGGTINLVTGREAQDTGACFALAFPKQSLDLMG